MLPALAILAAGANPTSALVLSQVVLFFGIPFALVPLVTRPAGATRWAATSTSAAPSSPAVCAWP